MTEVWIEHGTFYGLSYRIKQLDLLANYPVKIKILEPYYCGYVSFRTLSHDESLAIDVHGGVTYNQEDEVGFDCMHVGDTPKTCTLEYVRNECKMLAKQLSELG